jgi:hypothetical protein
MLNVMKAITVATLAVTLFTGCSKGSHSDSDQTSIGPTGFIKFTIPKGGHNSNNGQSEAINTIEYKFQVYFDSSAIYTLSPEEQLDINKLSDLQTIALITSCSVPGLDGVGPTTICGYSVLFIITANSSIRRSG